VSLPRPEWRSWYLSCSTIPSYTGFFFVVQNSHRRSIRAVFTGDTAMSAVRRPSVQRAYIREVAKQTTVLRLQGMCSVSLPPQRGPWANHYARLPVLWHNYLRRRGDPRSYLRACVYPKPCTIPRIGLYACRRSGHVICGGPRSCSTVRNYAVPTFLHITNDCKGCFRANVLPSLSVASSRTLL
jgi:hypothetical protein